MTPSPTRASPSSPWGAPATRSTPRSWPDGFSPRVAAGRRRVRGRCRGRQHVRLRRAGQEGLHRRPPRGVDLKRRTAAPRRSSRSAAWPSATARSSPSSLPEADAVLGFDSYRDMTSHLRRSWAAVTWPATRPGDRRRPASSPRPRARTRPSASRCRVTARALPTRPTTVCPCPRAARASSAPGSTAAPGRRSRSPSGCDRRCSFCAIPMFRGAFVSRRPADVLAEARWLAEHGVAMSSSPRTPRPTARTSATSACSTSSCRSSSRSRASSGCGCPTSSPPRSVPVSGGDGRDPRGRPVLRHLLPARVGPLLRSMRRFGSREAFLDLLARVRAHPPEAGIRQQRHRRLPRGDRGRPRRARGLPDRGPPRRGRRVRLLRRGRHRGRVVPARLAPRGRRRASRSLHPSRRGAQRPAGRGAHRRGGRSSSRRSTAVDGSITGRAASRARRSTVSPTSSSARHRDPGGG